MSDKKKAAASDPDWLGMQRRYLDALSSLGAGSPFAAGNPFQAASPFSPLNPFGAPAGPAPGASWANAMHGWWPSARPAAPDDTRDFFGKVLEQSRHYWSMSAQFSKLIEDIAACEGNNKAILDCINARFKALQAAAAVACNPDPADPTQQYEALLALMQAAGAGLSPWLSAGAGAFSPEAGIGRLRARLLSMPGLGYSRETQDKFQALLRLWGEYQDNYQEYQSIMTRLNQKSLALMQKAIIKRAKKDEGIRSMKQLYDLWIESSERAYGEYVFTDEYAALNGRLVNSLMAFRQKQNEISEDILAAMNMPTMRAMNTLERRQHQLRKQIKALEAELQTLKGGQEAASPAPAPAKAVKDRAVKATPAAAPAAAEKQAKRPKKKTTAKAPAKAAAPGAKKKPRPRGKTKTGGPVAAGMIDIKL